MGSLGEIIFTGSIQLQAAVVSLCYFLIAADFFFLCKERQGDFFPQKDLLSRVKMIFSQVWFPVKFY